MRVRRAERSAMVPAADAWVAGTGAHSSKAAR
jgi:hypothetical protein